jgi:hypothetical protein
MRRKVGSPLAGNLGQEVSSLKFHVHRHAVIFMSEH